VVLPLLANIYLHYVFDLWVNQWRRKWAGGDIIVVRYADYAVLGFQHRKDAEAFLEQLRERMRMYSARVGKERSEIQGIEVDETPKGSIMGDGVGMHIVVAKGTMAQLASRLSSKGAGRLVVDKGELPSLAVILQEQLGSKLEAAKGPVEFIVVDHLEGPPRIKYLHAGLPTGHNCSGIRIAHSASRCWAS
jgi:hypothetical protein